MTTGVRGVGVDIVDLGAFAASLAEPGTRLTRAFSATERRQCRERAESRGARPGEATVSSSSGASGASAPGTSGPAPARREDPLARHLAARWAAKEAVVKAWSAALYGEPPPIAPDLLRWSEIETVCDNWGRPSVRLGGEVARQVAATIGEGARWNVSLSHDGGSAIAFVVLEGPGG
ncbi:MULTISPECIES: holo-ACP synthase [Dietzia]|uniref:holo-ACP synthase n=1 Tax=Dietzia TaxID=37914 RepID=UPI000804C26B|nr:MULTISPECIES: holo-ACP synthase [Dietzia]MCZ4540028.1 holo-ACP synthase [Dietzia maris]MDV3356085.1 holo-ACP synthase [Dietzia sp. IN118]OAV76559.1 4-phosphopantetheinyl transferase [Dietzia sp. 111N12-1]